MSKAANAFAADLINSLEDADIKWREYSGRGMYGESCVAVSCGRDYDEGQVLHAIRNVTGALRITRDSLGMGTIVYWPRAKLLNDDEGGHGE